MEPKFTISEVFRTSWKYTKSQIWILVGLIIGMMILSFTLSIFLIPMQGSIIGMIISNIVSLIIGGLFSLGYLKNIFQTLDDEEPQLSAYGRQAPKIFTYIIASIIVALIVTIGFALLIIPGIYLCIRLQFFLAFIVEENAGIIESIQRSWEITKGQTMDLFLLALTMVLITIV